MADNEDTLDSQVLRARYRGYHQCPNCGEHLLFRDLITPKQKASKRNFSAPMTDAEIRAMGLRPTDLICRQCMELILRYPDPDETPAEKSEDVYEAVAKSPVSSESTDS